MGIGLTQTDPKKSKVSNISLPNNLTKKWLWKTGKGGREVSLRDPQGQLY